MLRYQKKPLLHNKSNLKPLLLLPHNSWTYLHLTKLLMNHDTFESLDQMSTSPSPRANSLVTPPPSPSHHVPQTMQPLFEAIDKSQEDPSSSLPPVTESILPHVTGPENVQSAIQQTEEEVTPPEFNATLGEFSSGAATTDVETTISHQDSDYIAKTPLKATTVEATIVSPKTVGSPQYQDKGASDSPIRPESGRTTTGRDSDDPINLGDGSKYQELTDRVSVIETSVADIKSDVKLLLSSIADLSKSQPSTADIANELWKSVSPIIIAHRKLADQSHETYMAEIRNMVDARYKDTHADIKAIKDHLLKTTGSAPTTILRDGL